MTTDVTCCNCACTLRSMAKDRSCTECGTPVAASVINEKANDDGTHHDELQDFVNSRNFSMRSTAR